MLKGILADFKEFLTSRGLADEKHAPFYARWVSKFFASSEYGEKLDFPQKKQKFLDSLFSCASFKDHSSLYKALREQLSIEVSRISFSVIFIKSPVTAYLQRLCVVEHPLEIDDNRWLVSDYPRIMTRG